MAIFHPHRVDSGFGAWGEGTARGDAGAGSLDEIHSLKVQWIPMGSNIVYLPMLS